MGWFGARDSRPLAGFTNGPARGKPVDKRTDIWAFGSVLYEMLTGKKAFGGETSDETVSDGLAAVLKSEPDWNHLPSEVNWRVQELLKRCVQKEPAKRLRDIGDARYELDPFTHDPLRKESDLPVSRPSDRNKWKTLALFAVLFGTATCSQWETSTTSRNLAESRINRYFR